MNYEAEITSENNENVVCQRCKIWLAPGEGLHYMKNADRNKPGRSVCGECHDYYLTKPTTRIHNDETETNTDSGPGPPDIHRQVAAAQRGETSLPVRPIGNVQNPTASSSSRIGLQVAAAQRASGKTSLPVRPIGNVQPRGARAPSGSSHSMGLQVPNIIAPANSKHNAQCMPPPPLPPGHNSRIAPLQQRGSGPVAFPPAT